ncbi:hypothetical protein HNR17_001918 [Galbitalea soli]|nr:hypothetical protein [Galbitalea soli]
MTGDAEQPSAISCVNQRIRIKFALIRADFVKFLLQSG